MARLAKLLGFPASLLLALLAAPASVTAAQNIDVALHASFDSPPLLIELLETAAQENSTSYFLLIDRIADGRFSEFTTDKDIYDAFLDELDDFEFLQTPGALSSFKLALSLHSSAPRIQAHYQFYKAAVEADEGKGTDKAPDVTIWGSGTKCWDLTCESTESTGKLPADDHTLKVLDFDRVYGKEFLEPPRTIYADIASPDFPKVYKDFAAACYQDQVPYRLRYKPNKEGKSSPLVVNGYGVELALKRTDYIVIDDRESQGEASEKSGATGLNEDEATDVKSLSSSEVRDLGVKTSSFIMNSDDPFATLSRISQDFPKHAAFLASQNASGAFLKEHQDNRDILLPAGLNILWMNGMQIPPRDINAFTLLDQLRRERKFIDSLQSLGITAEEAHKLLTHSALAENEAASEPQRYDWRDDMEGGQAIVWLNNIEKDKRYDDWPTGVQSLLQRVYPGQLPAVRMDMHNAIFPVDLSTPEAVELVLDHLQRLVKSQVPLRIGIVPNPTSGEVAAGHARVFYHLQEAYGLSAALDYLKSIVKKAGAMPTEALVSAAAEGRKLRREQKERTFWDLMNNPAMKRRTDPAKKYLTRLSADGPSPIVLGNGMLIPRNDEWMSGLGQRLSLDVRMLQRMVMEETLEDGIWVPSIFLKGASTGRNPYIVPEDEKSVKLIDFAAFSAKYATDIDGLYLFAPDSKIPAANKTRIMIFTDFNYDQNVLANAFEVSFARGDVEILFVHNTQPEHATTYLTMIGKSSLENVLKWENPNLKPHLEEVKEYLARGLTRQQNSITRFDGTHWSPLAEELGIKEGQKGILVNGRVVGPMPAGQPLTVEDFNLLLDYENNKRIQPVKEAIHDLGLQSKFTSGFDLARATSILSLSQVSDVPEGIFDTSPGPRMSFFDQFNTSFTCIQRGDKSKAQVQLVASIDPSSEIAQRWIPILDVLSKLDSVHLRIFLNPRENLKELPSKRFYRYVLGHEPEFDSKGSMKELRSQFAGIPRDSLLTMTMDTPPSWLVAPKDSVHDLDNIKLSSVKGGDDVTAVYELEHILIEGHSRDVNTGNPPRGAQLVLSTPNEPDFADTIIMANLGYFQFHANPGVYNLQLKEGKSQQVFNIDSAGTKGYAAQPGDNTTEITLLSFQGATVFPRLSRKPGQEEADVLAEAGSVADAANEMASDAARRADAALKQAGAGFKVSNLLSSAKQLGQKVLNMAGAPTNPHAEINIFSVASGHLYERMLHIMMLSVMKHTQHTVKFWFIEQFLSPSFKQSLPHLAAEYGFKYEMITYAWPHWLRSQKEKQRLIWGYKILFLDVLFPLDLDKVIFVDADQIVRTDMYDLVNTDLEGAPYGFTPMCDSRTEMEGFRFWKTGYWANFLHGRPYHISALYVVDLKRFRQLAAGDRLRQQYHALSADPGSLANLDQDLPNHMQGIIPIKSLDQDWLWCETWCSDEALKSARTIDLCNNPQTKEPKLDRAKRQVPEWTAYDGEIADVLVQRMGNNASGRVGEGGVQQQLQEEERREKLAEEAAKPKEDVKPPVAEKEKVKHEEL